MDYVLRPLARKGGVKNARDETRFAEQAWLMIYYSVFWTLGMVSWIPNPFENLFANTRIVYIRQLRLLVEFERAMD